MRVPKLKRGTLTSLSFHISPQIFFGVFLKHIKTYFKGFVNNGSYPAVKLILLKEYIKEREKQMQRIVKNKKMNWDTYTSYIKKLSTRYPHAEVSTCGKSHLKRELFSLSLGKGTNYVLYVGGVHAQEWITSVLLLRFYEDLCDRYACGGELAGLNVREILSDRRLIIIPELNPDGIEIALTGAQAAGEYKAICEKVSKGDYSCWNANARGVDINHNFDAGWEVLHQMERREGITAPSARRYGGTHAESEDETKALTRLCRELPIRHAIALHSQGEEVYWEYGKSMPPKAFLMAKIFAAITEYTLVKNEGLASHGGFKDWFISEFSRPAFTVEVGKGQNPLPISQLEEIYLKIEEMLCIGIIM